MWISFLSWLMRVGTVLLCIGFVTRLAAGASEPHYLITNDDAPFTSSVTFYNIGTTGLLTMKKQVETGGAGIAGGFFASSRVAVLDDASAECVYASDAATGDIVGIDVSKLAVTDSVTGSSSDSGSTNGIGLAMNSKYLYAGFTASNTIGTFQVQPGCKLTFVSDTAVAGLQGGFIEGMAIHGNIMAVTYGDGSIESFNIESGTPVANGDEQNSTGYVKLNGTTFPSAVEITKDGHYAVFGDTSTSTVVEVSDLASGKLSATTVFSLGKAINSSDILLSPDETLLYISNTQGDKITAAMFDSTTGTVSPGCASGSLHGYSTHWSYLAGLALQTNAGTGNTIYVAEYGSPSYIGVIEVGSSGGKCSLVESSHSPVADPNSPGLLSIGTFPPRSF